MLTVRDSLRLVALTACLWASAATPETPTTRLTPLPQSDVEELRRRLLTGRTVSPPAIDGRLDDPAWTGIPERSFLNSKNGARAEAATTFRMAYDDDMLYLSFRAFEKGQETQRHDAGPELDGILARDDLDLFTADCLEIFLQPGGSGTPYYQIVGNTAGSIFDGRWTAPGQREAWDSRSRVAGEVQADTWTLEVAVPFSDLGLMAPAAGTIWRANFCRTEIPSGEYTCWAPTRGGYHLTERYGHLEFGVEPEDAAAFSGTAEVVGRLVEETGAPVPATAVHFPGGTVRTDSLGRFRLDTLPVGDSFVRTESPRYSPFAARFTIDRQREVLPDISLVRRDPYRPDFSLARREDDTAITWLTSSLVEPPDMTAAPGVADRAEELSLLVTPDEYESRAVALYAHRAVDAPAAVLSPLQTPDGRALAADVDVRWTQRLLKRTQYTRDREDAVFNWRYLWREAPDLIQAGHVRQLVLTIRPPDEAAPGLYRGHLTVSSGEDAVASLPVIVQVAAFQLLEPDKRVGCYYRGRRLPDEQVRRELTDIHQHGGRVLVWHDGIWYDRDENGTVTYHTEAVERAVRLQREAGIGPPFLAGTNPRRASALAGLREEMSAEYAQLLRDSEEFRSIYAGGLQSLASLEEEIGAGEFLYTWMDEVFGRRRFEPWKAIAGITRELSDRRIYITMHNRNQALVDEADPFVDVRGYHGQYLDTWLEQGHTFDELKSELKEAGDEAWTYYNIIGVAMTPEWARLSNGYWLWRSPIAAHTPWIYYAFHGSAFDDLDADGHDFAYTAPHPTRPEMVSSLEWEAFREGYDDLRYLTTLETAIACAAAAEPEHPEVRKARQLRESWWAADPRVPAQVEALSAQDYQIRRAAMATAIETLKELGTAE